MTSTRIPMNRDAEPDIEPLLRQLLQRGWMLLCCGSRTQTDAVSHESLTGRGWAPVDDTVEQHAGEPLRNGVESPLLSAHRPGSLGRWRGLAVGSSLVGQPATTSPDVIRG